MVTVPGGALAAGPLALETRQPTDGTPLPVPRRIPASGLATAEVCPVDAKLRQRLHHRRAPPGCPLDGTILVLIRSAWRLHSASLGMTLLWGSMGVRHASTVPLIRITPLLNDRTSDQYKEMEDSSRCDRR
jgi:hypothetical protein